MRTASASSSYGSRRMTGPKISSRAIRMELDTSPKRVGSTYQPVGCACGRPGEDLGTLLLPEGDAVQGALLPAAGDLRPDLGGGVEGVADAEVLPAHEHASTGARARVRQPPDHHTARLVSLRALIAEAMQWNRPWEQIPFPSRNIAVAEAEAHLRRLVKLGHAEPVPGSDPVAYTAV